MAEYIDKERLKEVVVGATVFNDIIDAQPTADVVEIPEGMTRAEVEHRLSAKVCNDYVERSKIDKAIEEINKLDDLNPDYEMDKREYVSKREVLEIIKRNIGE